MITFAEPVELPLFPDLPLYTQEVTLAGEQFTLRFDYNAKQDRFYLSILDSDDVLLRSGIKVVAAWSVLRLIADGRPRGSLIFADPRSADADPPSLPDLGRRVFLYFYALDDTADAPVVYTDAPVVS